MCGGDDHLAWKRPSLRSQTEVAPPPAMVVVPTSKDAHACMDRLEQRMRHGAAQCWFASLAVSHRRTLDDLAQEFLQQFAFNTVIDVSWRELEASRSSERDHINMIMRSLQPRFARHLMGFPHVDFGSLVQALYGIEEGIARGLWPDSFPSYSKGKKPTIGQRLGDINAISAAKPRPPRYY
ncbi:hypothetical protein AAG906_029331 [Vitis piasezkii]